MPSSQVLGLRGESLWHRCRSALLSSRGAGDPLACLQRILARMEVMEPDRSCGFTAATAGEFHLRALTGGLLGTALVVGGFCAAGFEWRFLLLLSSCGAGATLVCLALERRRPATCPEIRYGLVGMVVAAAALLLLADSELAFVLVGALVALPAGAAGGMVAGLSAARLSARLLVPVLCLGTMVLLGAAAVAVSRTLPWLSGSYLVVEGPATASSAERLADQVAAALRAAPEPLSDSAWGKVASSAVTPEESGAVRIGYDRTAARRRITIVVNGERACVDVRAEQVTSRRGDCP